MDIVLGASGNVGSEVVKALLPFGPEQIIAVVHDIKRKQALAERGIEARVVELLDTEALRAVFCEGKRAFLLNPPAAPTTDTDETELATARSIAQALVGSGLDHVALASTYGAQDGEAIGDLSVLWKMERLVEQSGLPVAVNRAAYYFSNLDLLLEQARKGVIRTPFPTDMALPMVSASDLGNAAAGRLINGSVGLDYIEGPRRYTFIDVAAAFSASLQRPVVVQTIRRSEIEDSFRSLGFSEAAARSYTRMTTVTIDGGPETPIAPYRGSISLDDHIRKLVSGK